MTGRPTAAVLAIVLVALVGYAAARGAGPKDPKRTLGYGQVRFNGLGPEKWAARYRHTRDELEASRRRIRELVLELKRQRRVLLQSPHVVEAINLAVATYGFGSTLWRKAKCETGGTFSPTAHNASGASGLFQFLPSTWASTPFARFSIWSPYANALAAGWMHAEGRGGEWSCR